MALYFIHRCGVPVGDDLKPCRERVTSNSRQVNGSWWVHVRERYSGVHFDHRAGDVITEQSAPVAS